MTPNLWALGITMFPLLGLWLWASLTPEPPQLTAVKWQQFTLAQNNARRALGFVPALLLFWLTSFAPVSYPRLIIDVLLSLIGYAYLNPGNFFFPAGKKYVKRYRLSSSRGGARQVMSFKGEAGWQPDKKLQGMRWIPVIWNNAAYFNITEVPANAVWYIRSRIGGFLPAGRKTAKVMPKQFGTPLVDVEQAFFFENPRAFMVVDGQLNVQRSFLTPGYKGPIDLIANEVDDGTLPDSAPDKTWYKPFRVPDEKFGMVTCLDSAYPMLAGAIFARLGGFHDIEEVIAENFGDDEAEIKRAEGEKHRVATRTKPNGEVEEPKAPMTVVAKYKEGVSKPKHEDIKSYDDNFRFGSVPERSVAGKSLDLLLQGPPLEVEDYQNVASFDELKGTVGRHWRLIRPGRLLNLNRFVFDITLVDPFVVDPGTAQIMVLSTGVLARDITQKGFIGGRVVRVGGNGINIKALEPAQYPMPGYNPVDKAKGVQVGKLVSFVKVPTRRLSLFFQTGTVTSEYDADLNSITERSKDGIEVTYDFNVLLTIPAESGALIVAAYGDPAEFIVRVIATIVYGVTVEFIRNHMIDEIVSKQPEMLADIKQKLEEAVADVFNVEIHAVKLEHFAANAYLDVVGRIATAEATKRAFTAEAAAQGENKKVQLARGEAEANYITAKAEGDAAAVRKVFGATVEALGQPGAVLVESLKQMTSGKHPFVPTTLGVSQSGSGDGITQSLMPAMAMLSSVVGQINKTPEKPGAPPSTVEPAPAAGGTTKKAPRTAPAAEPASSPQGGDKK